MTFDFVFQNLFSILTLLHQNKEREKITWHSMTSYDITNVDAGHYCATFYGEGRVWKVCTLKEASGTDQSLLELRISTQTSPTPQLFRMPRLWKAVENLTDGLWPAQVDRISRTCRKQESIVRNFRIYFCASETAKFGGWLKIFTVNYPTKVKCCRSSSTGHAIAQGQKGAPNILWIYCMTIVVITMARDKYD